MRFVTLYILASFCITPRPAPNIVGMPKKNMLGLAADLRLSQGEKEQHSANKRVAIRSQEDGGSWLSIEVGYLEVKLLIPCRGETS